MIWTGRNYLFYRHKRFVLAARVVSFLDLASRSVCRCTAKWLRMDTERADAYPPIFDIRALPCFNGAISDVARMFNRHGQLPLWDLLPGFKEPRVLICPCGPLDPDWTATLRMLVCPMMETPQQLNLVMRRLPMLRVLSLEVAYRMAGKDALNADWPSSADYAYEPTSSAWTRAYNPTLSWTHGERSPITNLRLELGTLSVFCDQPQLAHQIGPRPMWWIYPKVADLTLVLPRYDWRGSGLAKLHKSPDLRSYMPRLRRLRFVFYGLTPARLMTTERFLRDMPVRYIGTRHPDYPIDVHLSCVFAVQSFQDVPQQDRAWLDLLLNRRLIPAIELYSMFQWKETPNSKQPPSHQKVAMDPGGSRIHYRHSDRPGPLRPRDAPDCPFDYTCAESSRQPDALRYQLSRTAICRAIFGYVFGDPHIASCNCHDCWIDVYRQQAVTAGPLDADNHVVI